MELTKESKNFVGDYAAQSLEEYRQSRITDSINEIRTNMYRISYNERKFREDLEIGLMRTNMYADRCRSKGSTPEQERFIEAAKTALFSLRAEYLANGMLGRILYQVGHAAGCVSGLFKFRKWYG